MIWAKCRIDFMRPFFMIRVILGTMGKWLVRKGEKHCYSCDQVKPRTFDFFGKNSNKGDGLNSECKLCRNRSSRNRYVKPYDTYRWSAKKRGYAFTISKTQFMKLTRLPCFYCGDTRRSSGLDRVDNLRGYEPSNVVPCCTPCNMAKRAETQEMFIARCKRVATRF